MIVHQLGLIGYPLSHSFSKRYFTEKFRETGIKNYQYELFPLPRIEDLPQLLQEQKHLIGLNVTIPYKEQVLPYLDHLDPQAAAIGAVNTILVGAEGQLSGYNTDVIGFRSTLKEFLDWNEEPYQDPALVLGTGGAAKAVAFVLEHLTIPYQFVSRTPRAGHWTYQGLKQLDLKSFPLIINTTPVGMAPKIDSCPDLAYHQLDERHFLYDLVYNPEKTLFLEKGERQGSRIMNGLPMLIGQAEAAWRIWTQG